MRTLVEVAKFDIFALGMDFLCWGIDWVSEEGKD